MKRQPVYHLKKVGNGWQCRVRGDRACGWGSRPDLAIRNWKEQSRLWKKHEPTTK